jgi:hypothetical protein
MSALSPNVPDVPGVPPVMRDQSFDATEVPLTTSGDETNADTASQWGLFDADGNEAVEADNTVAFELSAEARISDYPVEQGGFSSFNKVIVPYETHLVMTKGGSVEDRAQFLSILQNASQTTDLFSVTTPECTYLDMNITGVRRVATADRGSGLLTVELVLRKVRQTATLAFTATKEPAGASPVNDGSVQTAKLGDDATAKGNGPTITDVTHGGIH